MAKSRAIAATAIFAFGLAAAAASAQPPPSPAPSAPVMIRRACLGCHDAVVAAGKGRSPQEWSDTIDRMVDRGVDASDVEVTAVKAYLARTMPPGTEGPPQALLASQ